MTFERAKAEATVCIILREGFNHFSKIAEETRMARVKIIRARGGGRPALSSFRGVQLMEDIQAIAAVSAGR